jgi:hypothetical protein
MNDKKEVKLKPISLKIGRKEDNDKKYYNDSIFLICLSVILLIVTIFLIVIVLNDGPKTALSIKKEQPIIDKSNNLFNKWKTNNDSLFIFGSNSKFSWYDNYKELDNNFYQGTYTYKTNKEALEEMGYTEKEFKVAFPNISNLDNVYSLTLKPNYLYKNNLNVTDTLIKENETWWMIILIDDKNNVIAYNKTLDTRYELTLES